MRSILLYSLFFLSTLNGFAQENQHEKIAEDVRIDLTVGSTGTLSFPFANYSMNKRVDKGIVLVQLDMGEEYISDANTPFNGELKLNIEARKAGVAVNVLSETTATLSVNNDKPNAHFIINLLGLTETINGDENFLFDELLISVSESTVPGGFYGSTMRLVATSEVELGLDVTGLNSTVESIEVNDEILVSNKLANFKWSDNYPITNYEINILRLYNSSELTQSNEQDITTVLDWTKAMSFNGKISFDIQDNTKFFTLTLAEGTGFYVFRVRPLGAYHQKGIADERNWGIWSAHDAQNTVAELKINEIQLPYFFFTDPDQDRNWIYNRVFTEKSRVKENINFANGLQQPRQSQTYLPSQNVTLITQTILDYSGRPTVTTIPIPLPGRVSSYQKSLVKASGTNELYQAKHFDKEENYNNPLATVPFFYYDNNVDKSIPNDNGYGYTRTIFYNESSNRILKQSGVGEAHKIGSGKTTRYLHSTASEDELIALFGDEAPDNESVIKTITVDPNDIASVTYTSKEGNVIATSLAFYQQNTNLTALEESGNIISVQDKITKNSKTLDGFISSKRITLLQDNPNFQVSYSIACYQFEQLCQTATVDCDYQLVINLIEIGANGNTLNRQVLISENLSSVPCDTIDGNEYKMVSLQTPVYLGAGNYIIEKRLLTGNATLTIEENTTNIKKQIEPIVNLIAGWLEIVEDASMLQDFNKSLYDLSQAIDTLQGFTNGTLGSTFPVDIPTSFFTEIYDEYKDQYFLTFNPETYNPYGANIGENPFFFTLETPCCVINIPVKWIPPFDCELAEVTDVNGNNQYDIVNYLDLFDANNTAEKEYFPDFEGYMLAFMSDCVGPELDFPDEQALKEVIYGVYMDGWEIEGTFNMMVFHMLNDEYNTKNTIDETLVVEAQYECDLLLACWQGQLTRLKNEICTEFNFYQEDGSVNVSNEFDEQHGDDPNQTEPGHDPHFNDNFKGGFFLTRWIAKRKIAKKMRNLQLGTESEAGISPEFGQFHLVKEFLECTNYQFAKIITPFDAEPLTEDVDVAFSSYTISSTTAPVPVGINSVTQSDYFGGESVYVGGALTALKINGGYNYGYIPLNDWNPVKKVKNSEGIEDLDDPNYFVYNNESLFPNIKNPIYAFKYFEYADEGNSSFQSLEVDVCFNDPNDCYKLDGNGFIELDVFGQPIKVPCCTNDPTPAWNSPGCYADTEYPNLNASIVGYALDGLGVDSKLVVSNFSERGRIVCPYTHVEWSAGQRFTFYSSLKSVRVPSQNSGWNESADFSLTCTDLNTLHQWYVLKPDDDETQGYEELAHNDMYDATILSTYYSQISLADGTLNFKYVELDMEKQISACNTDCTNRRREFRDKLVAMLQSKCYQIGGCRTEDPATFYIIPEDDIDKMVDGMVAACGSQCNLTTFACAEVPSRLIARPFTSPGFDENAFELKFGMGGFDPAFCDDPNYTYTDATNCTDVDGDGILECDLLDASTGALNTLSWYEYTKLKQVAEWDFDVDMPTMCLDANGNPIATEDDLACCVADPNTYNGDTFVPKDNYELKSTRALDSNAPNIGDQVKSPTIGINVKIDPEG